MTGPMKSAVAVLALMGAAFASGAMAQEGRAARATVARCFWRCLMASTPMLMAN
ncbi:MAG: hypothetical protein HC783_16055 [Rhodobacteraceae bacterium]|nr:hypothetical protein [Paracoccaceae bacterium]